MKILVGKTSGFCMGVRRAVQLAAKTARMRKDNIYTLGPLIHNPQTIQMLRKKNVRIINDLDQATSGIVIIRAHGITPQKKDEVVASGLEYEDATCPLVKRIQSLIKTYLQHGYNIAIIGDRGHSEVIGLMGHALDRGTIIETEDDIASIPPGKVCVVAQSTQNHQKFDELVSRIKQRPDEVKVFDTICDATNNRQNEVRELSQKVDAMVIVGGKTSANTQRLAEISRSMNVKTFFIESEKELDKNKLKGIRTLGITAGASTPNWVIEKVIDTTRQISHKISGLRGKVWQVFDFIIKSELFLGLGAACLYYANTMLMGLVQKPMSMVSVGLITFALHMLNHYTDPEYTAYRESYKLDFFKRYKKLLVPLGVGSIIAALIFSAFSGFASFIFLTGVIALALLYNFRIVPLSLEPLLRFTRLRDVPVSKDVGVALVWACMTTVFPLLNSDWSFGPVFWVAFIFAFTIVFVRTLLLEIRDIQGDIMAGSESVPVMIGQKKTLYLMAGLLGFTEIIIVIGSLLQWFSPFGMLFLIPLAYAFLYLHLYQRRVVTQGITWEIIVGSNFVLAFIVALLWKILG